MLSLAGKEVLIVPVQLRPSRFKWLMGSGEVDVHVILSIPSHSMNNYNLEEHLNTQDITDIVSEWKTGCWDQVSRLIIKTDTLTLFCYLCYCFTTLHVNMLSLYSSIFPSLAQTILLSSFLTILHYVPNLDFSSPTAQAWWGFIFFFWKIKFLLLKLILYVLQIFPKLKWTLPVAKIIKAVSVFNRMDAHIVTALKTKIYDFIRVISEWALLTVSLQIWYMKK